MRVNGAVEVRLSGAGGNRVFGRARRALGQRQFDRHREGYFCEPWRDLPSQHRLVRTLHRVRGHMAAKKSDPRASLRPTKPKTVVGTGLTKRTITTYDFNGLVDLASGQAPEGAEALEILLKALPTGAERIAGIENWAKSVLQSHSILSDPGSLVACIQRDDDSQSWFAARILLLIEDLRAALSRRQTAIASSELSECEFETGLQLGIHLERFKWKFRHERAAEETYARKEGQRRGAAAGGAAMKAKANERHSLIIEAVKVAWRKRAKLVGEPSDTARHLSENSGKYFNSSTPPLKFDSMRKVIAAAIKAQQLP